MNIVNRITKDVDCRDPVIADEIKQAAREFAKERISLRLREDWLNNGPISLTSDLPDGWRDRLQPLYSGRAISLQTLGRLDLLMTKLFAYCDRQQDEDDCAALAPTASELDACSPWLFERDGNPYWPEHVRQSLHRLARMLGYEYHS